MHKLSTGLPVKQAGFTMIELVIVIVIIGILAAVAIPNLSGTADEARIAKQQAVLGALKGTWGGLYAITKAAPTCGAIAASMVDPTCTGTTSITCTNVTKKDGSGSATFSCTDAGITNSPAGISCALTGC